MIDNTLTACKSYPEYGSHEYFQIAGKAMYGDAFVAERMLCAYRFRRLWVGDAAGLEKYRARVDGIADRLDALLRRRSP